MPVNAPQLVIWSALVLLGIAGSAIFSGLETGTYVLNKPRLELRAAAGERAAQRLKRALDRPRELLSAILIANNAANFLVSTSAVALLALLGVRHADLYTIAVVSPLLFVCGEVVPKNIFRLAAETLTYRLSRALVLTMAAARWLGLGPIVTGFSHAAVRLWHGGAAMADAALGPARLLPESLAEGRAQGVLSPYQSRVTRRILLVGRKRLRRVMVPLRQVASIPLDCDRPAFDASLAAHEYSRLLVWDGRPENVVGVVGVLDVLCDGDGACPPRRHVHPPVRLPDGTSVADALHRLQQGRHRLALVTGRDGRPVGIVTIKDLVEEIVGELADW